MHDWSLSLLPDEEFSTFVRSLSENLELDFGTFIPHITLLWLPGDQHHKTDALNLNVQIQGFYCDIDTKQRVWYGLTVQKTQQLVDAAQTFAQQLDVDVDFDADSYFPHVTLGCTTINGIDQLNTATLKTLEKMDRTQLMTARICRNGEFGKVVDVIR